MLKVAVIGGGSTYTPELVNGFLARLEQFPLDELWLMDIDKERLEVVGGFAQRMVEFKGSPFKVVLTTNQREAETKRFLLKRMELVSSMITQNAIESQVATTKQSAPCTTGGGRTIMSARYAPC